MAINNVAILNVDIIVLTIIYRGSDIGALCLYKIVLWSSQ